MALVQHATNKQHPRTPARSNPRVIDWPRFLNRPLFTPCCSDCDALVSGRTVLITGAGGSIGSSLASLLMGGLADTLLFLDHSQQNLRLLYCKYRERHVTLPRVKFLHADIRCEDSLEKIFTKYRPDIVFHAAALKHLVPLESDPFAALENNVLGTIRLLQVMDGSPVECFVNVSTDKAVDPTSILGVSKRLSELLLLAIDSAVPRTLSLRLGNVLESSGSVVPLLMQSLESHQPLRISDPEAARYFLTLEEAATFLLKSLEIPESSLLLPEMGSPRRIIELAEFLLNEFGRENGSRTMRFMGLRPGEKCSEQLTFDHEYLRETKTPHLYEVCGNSIPDPERFADDFGRLMELVLHRRKRGLIESLSNLVPEFAPSAALLRYLC